MNFSTHWALVFFLPAGIAWGANAPADTGAALRLPDQRTAARQRGERTFVRIIGEAELKNLRNLEDALKKVPGFRIRKFAGLGGYAETMFRGSGGKQVQVMLDGVRLNTTANQSVDLGKIPLWMIREIQVDKSGVGPESLFENGVVTVHLFTRKKGRHSGSIQGRLGSFTTRELSGVYRLGEEKASLQLQSGYQDAKNDYPFPSDNGTQYNPRDDFTDHRKNNQFRNFYGDASHDRYLASGAVLTSSLNYRRYRKNFSGPFTRDPKAYTEYRDILGHAGLFRPLTGQYLESLQAKVDARHTADNYVDPEHTMGHRSYELRRTGWSFSGQAAVQGRLTPKLGLRLGIRSEAESALDQDLHHFNRYYAPPDARQFTLMPAVQVSWEVLENFTLTGSMKYPWVRLSSYRVESMARPVSEHFKTFFHQPVYQGHFKYTLRKNHSLFAKYARINRFPGFLELLGNNNGIRKNMALRPEFTGSLSAGWNRTGRHLNNEFIIFRNQYRSPIRLVYQSPPDSRFENTRGYLSQGAELNVLLDLHHIECRNALTFSHALIDDPQSNLKGNRPQFTHMLENFMEVELQPLPFLQFGGSMEYKSPYFFSDYNLDDQLVGSRRLYNAFLRINVHQGTMRLNAFNLGNHYYEDFRYNPNSGRSFSLMTEWNF